MNKISTYTTLKDFCDDLDRPINSKHVRPFKIFGRKTSTEFHSFSMIRFAHNEIENPDELFPAQRIFNAPFGRIGLDNCNLDLGTTYSTITPPDEGLNIFQADIIKLTKPIKYPVETSFACVLSHSCDLANNGVVSFMPVYLEAELDDAKVSILKGKPVAGAQTIYTINSWLENKNKKLLGLPAFDFFNNGGDSRAIINLKMIFSCPVENIPSKPAARLTYRALSYFQLRIAHMFTRDVKNSDETRQI